MKLFLTAEQIDEVSKELDEAKQSVFDAPEDDPWGTVFAQDRVGMLEEVLSRGYVVLEVQY